MITDISLINYRSYENDSFEFASGVNIIVGPNACGKTNLLESILVASRGFSFRAKDIELIGFNKPWARVEAHTIDFDRIVKLEKQDETKVNKSFVINSKEIKRLNLDQTLPVVLFEPNNMLLLIGSPELRRQYLDDMLEQTVQGFKTIKNQYKRTLMQRNSLLKQGGVSDKNFFVWNIKLSELGGKIHKERVGLVDKLQQNLPDIYHHMSNGDEKIELQYTTKLNANNYESDLLGKLEQNLNIDKERGFTSLGPHRDELTISLKTKLANEVASRGEMRSILLSLKIVETKIVEELRGAKPILLLDDVFSELDGARRISLTKILKDYQVFITTTDADVVIQHFTKSANLIALSKN
jgi:DNA replication and repair protein RecF